MSSPVLLYGKITICVSRRPSNIIILIERKEMRTKQFSNTEIQRGGCSLTVLNQGKEDGRSV
jgi:hypothetical protein